MVTAKVPCLLVSSAFRLLEHARIDPQEISGRLPLKQFGQRQDLQARMAAAGVVRFSHTPTGRPRRAHIARVGFLRG